jgi:hypothetical protein
MSGKVIETTGKPDEGLKALSNGPPSSQSWILEEDGSRAGLDCSESGARAPDLLHRSRKLPESFERRTELKTERVGAVIDNCLVCGRRLSWIRRCLRLECCWRRECWLEFDETRS